MSGVSCSPKRLTTLAPSCNRQRRLGAELAAVLRPRPPTLVFVGSRPGESAEHDFETLRKRANVSPQDSTCG